MNMYNNVFFGQKEEWDTLSDVSVGIYAAVSILIVCIGVVVWRSLPSVFRLAEKNIQIGHKLLAGPRPARARGDFKEMYSYIGTSIMKFMSGSAVLI